MARRSRRRRRSTLQQFRALPPAGKVFVVAFAVVVAVIVAVAGANSKPPAPAAPVPAVTPVSAYQPPSITPAPVPTTDGTVPVDTSGGGDVHLPLPHVYGCVGGRHVHICS